MGDIIPPDLAAKPRSPRRKAFLTLLAIVIAVAVAYFSFNWAVGAIVHGRTEVSVPNIQGKTLSEALDLLSQQKLSLLKEGEQYDKNATAGTVIRQNPVAGMRVREGRIVRVILSQGGETLFVPDLVGQPLRNAQTALQNAGLGVGEVDRKPSLRFEADLVMATDPPSGAIVPKNALVHIILSQGSPEGNVLLIPDFLGKSLDDVKAWTSANGLNVTVHEESDVSRRQGEILAQNPPPDIVLNPGEVLTVVVNAAVGNLSEGPHVRYTVPNGSQDRDIKILLMDEQGEREVFRKAQAPGSVIDLPVTVKGRARARVFINGVMVDQQDVR